MGEQNAPLRGAPRFRRSKHNASENQQRFGENPNASEKKRGKTHLFGEGRGGFVENGEGGLVEEEARECEALLLAGRERRRPGTKSEIRV